MKVHHLVDRHDSRLKIAVIVKSFPALTETFILNRITGLIKRGHVVDIYAKKKRDSDKDTHQAIKDYNILERTHYEVNFSKSRSNERYLKLKVLLSMLKKSKGLRGAKYWTDKKFIVQQSRFKRRKEYDLIHAFYGINGLMAMHARTVGILEGPISVSFHGFDLSRVVKKNPIAYNQLFQKGDLFLPVCNYYKDKLIKLGCPIEKIKVHPSSIDINKFLPDPSKRSSKKVKILSIGRLIELKGFRYSIQAVGEFIQENPTIEITYRIIGSGLLKDDLLEEIDSLQLSDKIDIREAVNHKKLVAEIQSSDILICPSIVADDGIGDTLPNVLKEAMACELAVIASDHAGIPELVKHRENGFLVPEKDINQIKKAIEVLVNSPELREELGKQGRRYVQKYYEIESKNDIISDIYKELANSYSQVDATLI
jgi:colanic acid/amylovoran biosynthesis glycosyltransferase